MDFSDLIKADAPTHRVDEYGIVHLDSEDFYYREVPREFFDGILSASGRDEAVSRFYQNILDLPSPQRAALTHYALNPARASAAVLGAIGEGTVVLDYGCGWGTIARTISGFGATVVAMDATHESLVLSRLLSTRDNEIYVKGGRSTELPFRDATFDTIILNGVLEWLPEGYMVRRDPRDVQLDYLREFRRVLKPDGRLLVGIENRNSFLYWSGQREDHTGLRFCALLPRPLANAYSRLARRKPYRTYTYAKRGYERLFRDAGFASTTFFAPWLRYRDHKLLLSMSALKRYPLGRQFRSSTVRGNAARIAVGVLQRLGVLHLFVPDYYIVAGAGGREVAPAPALLEQFVCDAGARLPDDFVLTSSSVPAVHTLVGGSFVKVPLTAEGRRRLGREIEALGEVYDETTAPFIVDPASCHLGPRGRFGVFPRIDAVDAPPRPDRLRAFLEALGELRCRTVPLHESDAFFRAADTGPAAFADALSGGRAGQVMAGASGKRVPCGPVHGDFCRQNVLSTRDGIRVIDWDRYDAHSPKFLDPLHWLVDDQVKRRGADVTALFRGFQRRVAGSDLESLLWKVRGELSVREVLVVYLCDRVARDVAGMGLVVGRGGDVPPAWEAYYRRAFAGALGGGGDA